MKVNVMAQNFPKLPKKLADAGWQIHDKLGGGGQGGIFSLYHPDFPQNFALKLPNTGCSGTDLERFRREIQTLAAIDHPNVMNIIEFDVDDTIPWMVMPQGQSLDKWWEQIRISLMPTDLFDHAYQCAMEVLMGLTQFHERGETHRDLKPQNVIVVDGTPKVSDAGLIFNPE